MQKMLAFHRGERRALAAVQGQASREAAEAAAAAAMDSLLAEEEAEKASVEVRQAKAKRKKQRQKSNRAEAVPWPAQTGGARSGPAPSGADLPSQCSGSQAIEEGQRAAAEDGVCVLAMAVSRLVPADPPRKHYPTARTSGVGRRRRSEMRLWRRPSILRQS